MSRKRRIPSAAVRVASLALVTGILAAAVFGAVRPVTLVGGTAFLRHWPLTAVVSAIPRVGSARGIISARRQTSRVTSLAVGTYAAPWPAGLTGARVPAPPVSWSADFAGELSRTRGPPFSIA